LPAAVSVRAAPQAVRLDAQSGDYPEGMPPRVSAETRARMSAAHKRRGTRPRKAGRAWTAHEDGLVHRLTPPQVARLTGRSLLAVHTRRSELGINRRWTPALDGTVRQHSPERASILTGKSLSAVWSRRHLLGVNDGNRKRWRRTAAGAGA
jgi:hypothetical protein